MVIQLFKAVATTTQAFTHTLLSKLLIASTLFRERFTVSFRGRVGIGLDSVSGWDRIRLSFRGRVGIGLGSVLGVGLG